MSNTIQNEYMPNYVSPPGETLLETLEAVGMSQAELAKRAGRAKKFVNEIIKGKATITPETALQLERVLGVPASFWNNRERQYQEAIARLKEQERLKNQLDWLEKFPVTFMVKSEWMKPFRNKVQQLGELLNFFGVASPEQLQKLWDTDQVAFRKSPAFKSDWGAVITWLRKGEIDAQQIHCDSYDPKKFREALYQIRALTVEPPEVFQPELVCLCAKSGVAVVFVPRPPKTHLSSATRWLVPHKALIQLSLRYKTDDHFWFNFFHEAAHILCHGKRDIFIEIEAETTESIKEQEANNFASNILIPYTKCLQFIEIGNKSKRAIRQFASELGIAPGIVVGRLQYEKFLPYSHYNDLKRRFAWAE